MNFKKWQGARWHLSVEESIKAFSEPWLTFQKGKWAERHWQKPLWKIYGVWRWAGIIKHAKLLLDLIGKSEVIVDFGGFRAKLGFGSYVVDIKWGIPPAEFYKTCKNQVDLFFSSNTLEHIKGNIDEILQGWKKTMGKGAALFLQVPSYKNKRWNHIKEKRHFHTFYINSDIGQIKPEPIIDTGSKRFSNGGGILTEKNTKIFDNIEELVGRHFKIKLCENVDDWNIVIVAVTA